MNFDETERKMEFIVEQQAQFRADMQVLRETQAQTEQVVARLAYATLEGFKDVNAKIDALVDADIRLSDRQEKAQTQAEQRSKEWDERFNTTVARLFESQEATDEALRRFIETVDRRFDDKSNGSGNG